MRKHPKEYSSWDHMKARCYNPKSQNYKHYGGKGIIVCGRWLNSFENFYEDMGACPSKKHSLDRIDVIGNYEPTNCRWSTQIEQQRNRIDNVYLLFNGERKTLSEWSIDLNIPARTISGRNKKGLPINMVLNQKYRKVYTTKLPMKLKQNL